MLILILTHSNEILTKQQGWPREVSSVGNPRQALTGFNSGSVAKLFALLARHSF